MISKKEFDSAQPGDALIDMHGRPWTVTRTYEAGSNIKGLMVEESGDFIGLVYFHGQIIEEEEWAVVIELNHEQAHFQRAA